MAAGSAEASGGAGASISKGCITLSGPPATGRQVSLAGCWKSRRALANRSDIGTRRLSQRRLSSARLRAPARTRWTAPFRRRPPDAPWPIHEKQQEKTARCQWHPAPRPPGFATGQGSNARQGQSKCREARSEEEASSHCHIALSSKEMDSGDFSRSTRKSCAPEV